jgi:acyl dehydratase
VMHAVERKHGRRAGTFDAITVALDLIDVDGDGSPAVSTTETYIVPRRTLNSAPTAAGAMVADPVESVATGGYPVGPIALEDIIGIMDVMGDTNPVHIDLELALASGYRGIVHQGPANLGFIFNAMAADRGTITDIRHAAFTFLDTVTEGDRLEVRLTRPELESGEPETLDGALVILGADVALTCRAQFGAR